VSSELLDSSWIAPPVTGDVESSSGDVPANDGSLGGLVVSGTLCDVPADLSYVLPVVGVMARPADVEVDREVMGVLGERGEDAGWLVDEMLSLPVLLASIAGTLSDRGSYSSSGMSPSPEE